MLLHPPGLIWSQGHSYDLGHQGHVLGIVSGNLQTLMTWESYITQFHIEEADYGILRVNTLKCHDI